MTCSPTCCPPGACAASPASSNARCPTLGSRRALTATGPSRPSHPPKPSPSDEPDPRQTHNATALGLALLLGLRFFLATFDLWAGGEDFTRIPTLRVMPAGRVGPSLLDGVHQDGGGAMATSAASSRSPMRCFLLIF